MTAARLTVDLGALAHNFAVLRDAAPGAETAPVVKADGYGLGAGPVALRLWGEGAHTFFVARLAEGESLRAALGEREARIFILDGVTAQSHARLTAARLTPILSTLDQIAAWAGPAGLHVDTGMNRIGLDVDELETAAALIAARGVELTLLMSHLSCAAEPDHARNATQLARFEHARRVFPGVPASLAASAGIFLSEAYRADMVRPGISLFGGGPREVADPRFRAVATLEAPILQVRELSPGDAVGYGRMFTATRPTTIAVLAAGYADGVLRGSHTRGFGAVAGRRTPFVIVSMDMIAVDITGIDGISPGDMVELLGPNVLLDDVAAASGTVAHECLVRLNARAERVYVG